MPAYISLSLYTTVVIPSWIISEIEVEKTDTHHSDTFQHSCCTNSFVITPASRTVDDGAIKMALDRPDSQVAVDMIDDAIRRVALEAFC